MNKSKRLIASLLAATVLVPAAVNPAMPLTASAAEMLAECDFEQKVLPWHIIEVAPARQDFYIDKGALHLTILKGTGATNERYDLRVQYPGLSFKKGHTYEVSFKVKAKRSGMEMFSSISNANRDEYYFCTNADGKMEMGPDMGGMWGSVFKLSTEYQTVSGTFKPTEDLENALWHIEYASGATYGGNAQDGDELWFDEMHIVDKDEKESIVETRRFYTDRSFSGLEHNFVSVNQLGYYPQLAKTAALSDNKGSLSPDAATLDLMADTEYDYQIIDHGTGKVAYEGKTAKTVFDKDSGDTVAKIDFSKFKEPGEYYIVIPGLDARSFTFRIADDIYQQEGHDLLTNTLNYFYQNRAGQDTKAEYITSTQEKDKLAHADQYKTDTAYVQDSWVRQYLTKDEASVQHASSTIDASGGWYDARYFSKNMVSGGYTLWVLQNMYERAILNSAGGSKKFADGSGTCVVPETGDNVPDILQECRHELDFMEKMKVAADEPTWGKYAGLYYHSVQDHIMPELAQKPWNYIGDDEAYNKEVRIVKPPTLAATLNYAACAAQAARLWKDFDEEYAKTLYKRAKDAYEAFWQIYSSVVGDADLTETTDPYIWATVPKENLNEKSLYAPVKQSAVAVPYGDMDISDDAYWAACELFISAIAMEDTEYGTFRDRLSKYKDAFSVPERIRGGNFNDADEGSLNMLNTGNMTAAGTLTLALHSEALEPEKNETIRKALLGTADTYLATEEKQGFSIPYLYDGPGYTDPNDGMPHLHNYGFEEGSNARALNNMIALAYAYDLTGKTKYLDGVAAGMDYLLGNNPLSFSYITGYGNYGVCNPSHEYWLNEIDKTFPKAPDGVLSGGASTQIYDQYMRLLGFVPYSRDNISERCYADSVEAFSVNSTALEYNAPLAWVVSFLQDEGPHEVVDTPKELIWGDVNESGDTDVSDAVLLARFLAEDKTANISTQGQRNANVVSGKLNQDDLIAILMSIVKLIDSKQFPLDKLPGAK